MLRNRQPRTKGRREALRKKLRPTWLSVLLGYVVVSLAAPGADPVLAHRLDFLCGGVGFEAASWLDSLIGWGTVLLLAFALISFVVFFFNVTSIWIEMW